MRDYGSQNLFRLEAPNIRLRELPSEEPVGCCCGGPCYTWSPQGLAASHSRAGLQPHPPLAGGHPGVLSCTKLSFPLLSLLGPLLGVSSREACHGV